MKYRGEWKRENMKTWKCLNLKTWQDLNINNSVARFFRSVEILSDKMVVLNQVYGCPYYWGDLSMDQAIEVLLDNPPGSFLLRNGINGSLCLSRWDYE